MDADELSELVRDGNNPPPSEESVLLRLARTGPALDPKVLYSKGEIGELGGPKSNLRPELALPDIDGEDCAEEDELREEDCLLECGCAAEYVAADACDDAIDPLCCCCCC